MVKAENQGYLMEGTFGLNLGPVWKNLTAVWPEIPAIHPLFREREKTNWCRTRNIIPPNWTLGFLPPLGGTKTQKGHTWERVGNLPNFSKKP